MGNSNEVGEPPEPKSFDNRDDFIAYYGSFDVETEDGKREFQREVLSKLSQNACSAALKREVLPKDVATRDKQIISTLQETIHQDSIEEEAYDEEVRSLCALK